MKLALVIVTFAVAVGFALSLPPYALMQNGLEPEKYDRNGFVGLRPLWEADRKIKDGEENHEPDDQEISMEELKSRVRRQATVDVTRNTHTGGTAVSAQVQGNLWNNGPHRLDGNANWARVYGGRHGTGHPAYGGGLTYSHSNRASLGADVSHQRPFGTQVSAQAQGVLWRSNNGRSSVDANAGWSRSFGGAWGASRPNYGGMINFRHRF